MLCLCKVNIVLIHFPLHPDTPQEGHKMAGSDAQRELGPQAMYQRMKTLMDAEGLPYGHRTTQRGLPIGPECRQTMTRDRHGTTTPFAALSVLDGKVIGRCMLE
jgi:hypothetical protein